MHKSLYLCFCLVYLDCELVGGTSCLLLCLWAARSTTSVRAFYKDKIVLKPRLRSEVQHQHLTFPSGPYFDHRPNQKPGSQDPRIVEMFNTAIWNPVQPLGQGRIAPNGLFSSALASSLSMSHWWSESSVVNMVYKPRQTIIIFSCDNTHNA